MQSLLAILPLVMSAASVAAPTPEPAGFRLVILQQSWGKLSLGYKSAPAFSRLRETSLADALITLAGSDIESYEWDTQTIRLTDAASRRLLAALPNAEQREKGVQALTALTESLGWGNPVERALYTRAFVVLLGDERLYGGVFLDPPSQMGIDFPVARCRIERGRIVFSLLPVQLPFFDVDPGVDETPAKEKRLTQDHGPVDEVPSEILEHFQNTARAPHACAMRALIRDPRIREAVARHGVLRESASTH